MHGGGNGYAYFAAHPQRNLLVNSSFAFMQRQLGSESTDTAYNDDAYAWDRSYVLTQTAAVQCSRQAGFSARGRYCGRLKQHQASAQRMGWAQIVDAQSSYQCRGQYVTFQGRCRSSSSQLFHPAIIESTAAADAVASDVVGNWASGSFTAGGFFQGSGLSIPSTGVGSVTPAAATDTFFRVSAVLSASCNNVVLLFWSDGTCAQNTTLELSELWFGIGPGPLFWMEEDPAVELVRCNRFFRALGFSAFHETYGIRQGTTIVNGTYVTIGQSMRAGPTTSHSNPTWSSTGPSGNQIGFFRDVAGAYSTLTGALSFTPGGTTDSVLIKAVAGTSFSGSSGDVGRWVFGNAAYVYLDAEL